MERKTILICDDEEGIRESLRLILEKEYNLLFVNTGDAAVEKVRSSGINLIILDIKMPKKDGLETLKELKKTNPDAKVIIATGYKSVNTAQEAFRLGACDYIVKPFETNDVMQAVKKAL